MVTLLHHTSKCGVQMVTLLYHTSKCGVQVVTLLHHTSKCNLHNKMKELLFKKKVTFGLLVSVIINTRHKIEAWLKNVLSATINLESALSSL